MLYQRESRASVTRILNWELSTGEMGTGHRNVVFVVHRTWKRWSGLLRAREQHLVLAEHLTLNDSWLLVLCSLTRPGRRTPLLPPRWAGANLNLTLKDILWAASKYTPRVLMVFTLSVLWWMVLGTEFCASFLLICLVCFKVCLPCRVSPSRLTRCWLGFLLLPGQSSSVYEN